MRPVLGLHRFAGMCVFGDGMTDRFCVECSDAELTIYVCAGVCWKAHKQSRGHQGCEQARDAARLTE